MPTVQGNGRTVYFIDQGMIGAVQNYILYGLSPGSCTEAMICGDKAGAKARAHPNILTGDSFNDTFAFINDVLPEEMIGEDNYQTWKKHGGYQGAPRELKVTLKLMGHNTRWHQWIDELLDKS